MAAKKHFVSISNMTSTGSTFNYMGLQEACHVLA